MTDRRPPGIFSGIVPGPGMLAGLLVVTLLAVAAALAAALYSGGDTPVEEVTTPQGAGEALVLVSPQGGPGSGSAELSDGLVKVAISDVEPNRAGEYYALWLANDDEDLLPIAAFRVDASRAATITVPVPGALDDYRRLEISREPDDGDPGRSGTVVLRASTR